MMKALLPTDTCGKQKHEIPLIIPRAVFSALHPMDKIGAKALEKVGAAIIVEESEWV